MNNKPDNFSARKRLLSFRYAFRGIRYMLKTQHNAWIHLFAAFVVIFAGFWFSVSTTDWVLIVLAIGFVFTAETFNTAIELMVDKISPEYDNKAGIIKDVAAGAVLFSAIAAAVVGIIVFGTKMGM